MDKIRFAAVGTGAIVHSILDAAAVTEGITCVAVCSRSAERGRALAQKYGVQIVYTDYQAVLADPQVDFVYLATPNSLHYEQTKQALEASKNVICEKPFCTKGEQARELVALAKEKGLFLVDAVPTAFLPNFELLKAQLPKIGRLRTVVCSYTQYSARYDRLLAGEVPLVFDPNYAGGCLQDINFYNVYLNVALFGKPACGAYYPNLAHTGVDTSGVAVLRYPDFISTNAAAKDARGESLVQIQGERGCISIPGGSNGLREIRVTTQTGEEVFNAQENPDRWYHEVQNLVPLLRRRDYDAIYSRLDTMISVIETMEALRKTAGILFPGDESKKVPAAKFESL